MRGATGFAFGKMLWDLWNAACAKKGEAIYSIVLNFNDGTTVPLDACSKDITAMRAPVLETASSRENRVTSYWFGAVGATLADLRRAPWHERAPLGNWLCKGNTDQSAENLMPLRYARTKGSTEQYVKLMQVEVMSEVVRHVLPPVVWDKIRNAIESLNWPDLRCGIADSLDNESKHELAFRGYELPDEVRDTVGIRIRESFSRDVYTLALLDSPSSSYSARPPLSPSDYRLALEPKEPLGKFCVWRWCSR